MNKCNFCNMSIPTGCVGGWKCNSIESFRKGNCEKALETMKEYNETRSNEKKNKD